MINLLAKRTQKKIYQIEIQSDSENQRRSSKNIDSGNKMKLDHRINDEDDSSFDNFTYTYHYFTDL
jgi:hypothetical protein